MRYLVFVLAGLAASCARSREPVVGEAAVVCQVTDKVYHDGWKTIRKTRVFADGTYEITDSNPWRPAQAAQQFRGKVPAQILKDLQVSARDPKVFLPSDGVPTYEVCIDDWRTRHPESVVALEKLLHEQHSPE